MKRKLLTLLLLGAAALVLPAALASAEEARTYGPGVLKPEQVKQCISDRNEVVTSNHALRLEKDRLTQEADSIARVEAGLVQQQADMATAREELVRLKAATRNQDLDGHLRSVQTFKQKQVLFNAQVKTYNEGVTEQQQRRDRYNAAVLDLNGRLDQLRNQANETDYRCAGVRAYQDDIRSAKEALGEEPAPPQR